MRCDVVFVSDRGETLVAPKTLLAEFPDSLYLTIARTSLRPNRETPRLRPGESALHRFAGAVFPGYVASRHMDPALKRASLRRWLRRRAEALVPDQRVRRVEIRWFEQTLRLEPTGLTARREPLDTLAVSLDHDD